jgi:cobalamin biosynthesis protein CobD/CbiB
MNSFQKRVENLNPECFCIVADSNPVILNQESMGNADQNEILCKEQCIHFSLISDFFAPITWYIIGSIAGVVFRLDSSLIALASILMYTLFKDLHISYHRLFQDKSGLYKHLQFFDNLINYIPVRISVAVFISASLISGLNTRGVIHSIRDNFFNFSQNHVIPLSCFYGAMSRQYVDIGDKIKKYNGIQVCAKVYSSDIQEYFFNASLYISAFYLLTIVYGLLLLMV